MELSPGCKWTEVGVIPAEWAVSSIFDLAQRRKELFDDGDWVEAEYLAREGVRLVQTGNLGVGEFIERENKKYISPESFAKLRCKALDVGDVLICRLAVPAGRACILPDIGEERVITAVDVTIFRPPQDIADRRFLVSVFSTSRWFREVNDRCGGSTRTRISRSELGKIVVQLPPVNEQRAIATALDDVSALLVGIDRLIAKKRNVKQAAMQQLLTGQTRLPGFYGEWETRQLGELATFHKGRGLPKSALSPFGSESCIHYGELFAQYGVSIRETISRTNLSFGEFRSIANDVLMPTSDVTPRGLAKASCVLVDSVVLGGDILVIRTDPARVSGTFLSHVIRRQEADVLRLVTGTTVFHLYGAEMKKFVFELPSLIEQRAIVGVLADMEVELSVLEARREKTRALKEAMMQELLTGRTRLVPAEHSDV